MAISGLADHLGRHFVLSECDRAALADVAAGHRQVKRGTVLRVEHGAPGDIFVIASGWLFCSALLEDGRRQIVRLHFSGDLLGLDSLAFEQAPDGVTALTDAELCVIDRDRLGRLFASHPRLGALLFAVQQIDRVTLTDRLISLGRASARGRVAALLLWIASRLRSAGQSVDDGFPLPLTQEEIGDLTGLTAVHVNRTLRVLGDEGLIQRSAGMLRLLDPGRLARIASHDERNPTMESSWLPA